MARYNLKVRVVVEYDITVEAPDLRSARYAIRNPFEPCGVIIGNRSDFTSTKVLSVKLDPPHAAPGEDQ
jgi:hypothetical protein